jgi:F-type H+-transporting ATPase subunit a
MDGIHMTPDLMAEFGPVRVTSTVVDTWVVMAALALVAFVVGRRLAIKAGRTQSVTEAMVEAVERVVAEVAPTVEPASVVPVLGTLWLFIAVANLAGLMPGLDTPTADLNTTIALALISFSMSHVYGIRAVGLVNHLRHYTEPSWVLMPFHLMAEASRTLALAIRLFGNMISGELIALIMLGLAGLVLPVPFDLLHIVIGLIQAYIFGILTLVFIAEGAERHAQGRETPGGDATKGG